MGNLTGGGRQWKKLTGYGLIESKDEFVEKMERKLESDQKYDRNTGELLPQYKTQLTNAMIHEAMRDKEDFQKHFEMKRKKKLIEETAFYREVFLFSSPVFLLGSYLYYRTSTQYKNIVHRGLIPYGILSTAYAYTYSRGYGKHSNRIEEHIDDILTNDNYWFIPLEPRN
eukprot:TRINITY_DN3098_c0_g1_i1.p1 TRINITY_DN3098_c0_g1~~TRINITY_DN3098_c0_g1_i1.p1  ORF type:complete len:170 (+),score=2.47 TRINITY_DN3098_c0_g1_i1:72-581(+)